MTVVVVGSGNVDLVSRVERIPAPGETVLSTGFATHPGGTGNNQATAATRAGAATTFIAAFGADDHGALLRAGGAVVLNAAPATPLPRDLLDAVPAVVVTLGAAGALVTVRDAEPIQVTGIPVDVVDTTGAVPAIPTRKEIDDFHR